MATRYEELGKSLELSKTRDKEWSLTVGKAPMLLRTELSAVLGLPEDAVRKIGDREQRVISTHYIPWTSESADVHGRFLDSRFYGPALTGLFVLGLLLGTTAEDRYPQRFNFDVAVRMEKGDLVYAFWRATLLEAEGAYQPDSAFAELLVERTQSYLETDITQGIRKPLMGFL